LNGAANSTQDHGRVRFLAELRGNDRQGWQLEDRSLQRNEAGSGIGRPLVEESVELRGRKRRILVVDDNRDTVESLALLLEMMEYDVRTAEDGLAALEVARAFRPDIVLLDIGLPRLDGYETAQRVRQLDDGGTILLVALTGWGQDEDRRRSAAAGFDHHLVKPVDPDALERLLRQQAHSVRGDVEA
jgi:CheY-like chemotaxis protein